jgi:hypothetical protein
MGTAAKASTAMASIVMRNMRVVSEGFEVEAFVLWLILPVIVELRVVGAVQRLRE